MFPELEEHPDLGRYPVNRPFFIAGPTAIGKSELAADVAAHTDAEIVNADAFQIYRGLDVLTARPAEPTTNKAPHHLLGVIPAEEEMNAEKFRRLAKGAIDQIYSRNKRAIVVGGSGLYLKVLTHGLSNTPPADRLLRDELNGLSLEQLAARLREVDPDMAATIDIKNRRRLVRALEICALTGKPASKQRVQWKVVEAAVPSGEPRPAAETAATTGVFVFRDREELYERINCRVHAMFQDGVIEEVRALGRTSATAAKAIGLPEIRALLEGKISASQCVAQIQQATRRYAKRQLTWFRRQTSFEPLNLSHLSHGQAVEWITQRTRRSSA